MSWLLSLFGTQRFADLYPEIFVAFGGCAAGVLLGKLAKTYDASLRAAVREL